MIFFFYEKKILNYIIKYNMFSQQLHRWRKKITCRENLSLTIGLLTNVQVKEQSYENRNFRIQEKIIYVDTNVPEKDEILKKPTKTSASSPKIF
jgi:hypothetical protein